MNEKITGMLARATLDNLMLPAGRDVLKFSGFFIKKSPNCMRDITVMQEDGTKTIIQGYPDEYEDDYKSGFPKCEYCLELELGEAGLFDFDKAEKELIWALTRLRLFKPGCLWGELYGIYNSKEPDVVCCQVKRTQEQGPDPFNYPDSNAVLYIIKKNEVDSLVNFVNGLKNVPTDSFAVALRRFHRYFDRDLIQDRAIDLMIVLESIFSDSAEAIAYKIALRAACLTESEDPIKRKALFDFLKKAYDKRSSIVHGREEDSWLREKTYIPTQTNLDSLEEVVRNSLLILLRNAQSGIILKPADLDRYLFFNPKPNEPQ
jgi:hypothetical protein